MATGGWASTWMTPRPIAKPSSWGSVLSGELGGPPAMLGPLIGEMLGVEKARITYSEDGRGHHVRIGDAIDVGVEDFVAAEGQGPVQLANVLHPSNSTLTVSPANAAHL